MGSAIKELKFLSESDRQHLMVIAADLRRRSTVLFCGAGLSFNARRKDGSDRALPGWWQLTQALAKMLPGVNEDDSALRVADLYETTYGRNRLIEKLQELIPDQEYEPSDVHELIPLMGFSEIITTNFDTLLERAYANLRVRPTVVLSGKDLVASRSPRVLKINGCFERNPQEVVITGEDFRRYTDERPLLVSFLTSCFVENLVLFAGFSLDDPAFRTIFGQVRDILGKKVRLAYSIQGDVPESQVQFWQKRGLVILNLFSGEKREDLTFRERLRLVLRALLEETRRDVFSIERTGPVSRAATAFAEENSVHYLRKWLWSREQLPEPAEGESFPVGTWLNRVYSLSSAHPRLFLATLLPDWAWDLCIQDASATTELCHSLLDLEDRLEFGLAKDERDGLLVRLFELKHLLGSVKWQSFVSKLLGEIITERFHPLRAMAGCLSMAWARDILVCLAKTVEPRMGVIGDETSLGERIRPELPVLILQVYWMAWVEEADQKSSQCTEAKRRLSKAMQWLDLRSLAASDASRQREAISMLMMMGTSEDVELLLEMFERRPISERLTNHLRSRRKFWRSSPPLSGVAVPNPEDDDGITTEEIEEIESRQAHYLIQRVQDLAPDFRFRFISFHRDPSRDWDLYGSALDWIRGQVFNDVSPYHDHHKLNLVYRHHYLYQDFAQKQPGNMEWPFHKQVQDQLVALYERSESRRTHKVTLESDVKDIIQHLMLSVGQGKAMHRFPPKSLSLAWKAASQSLTSRFQQPIAWEMLLLASLPADGGNLIEKRGKILEEVLERDLLDLQFILDFWLHRIGNSCFRNLDRTQSDGRLMEDSGGLARSLTGLSAFLRFVMDHVEWDGDKHLALLQRITKLCSKVLHSHHDFPHVQTQLISVLASLTALVPLDDIIPIVQSWMNLGSRAPAQTSLGLAKLDWRRMLTGPREQSRARSTNDFQLTRQLLARAMGPTERRTGLGRDLNLWALTLYSLDREGQELAGQHRIFALPVDVKLLIEEHFSQLIGEECQQISLGWLYLAGQARVSGIAIDAPTLGLDDPTSSDPLLDFVENWMLGLQKNPLQLRDWHMSASSYLGFLEAFVPTRKPSWAALGSRALLPGLALVRFVLDHLDKAPTDNLLPDPPNTLLDYNVKAWDMPRRNSVASYLSVVLNETRSLTDEQINRPAMLGLLEQLIENSATADGKVGLVVDMIARERRQVVERNMRVSMLVGNPDRMAAGVERAALFLDLAAQAGFEGVDFPKLEAQLIQAASGQTRPRRDRAILWLTARLQQDNIAAFLVRHRQSLETLKMVLEQSSSPRPPLACQQLLQYLSTDATPQEFN